MDSNGLNQNPIYTRNYFYKLKVILLNNDSDFLIENISSNKDISLKLDSMTILFQGLVDNLICNDLPL